MERGTLDVATLTAEKAIAETQDSLLAPEEWLRFESRLAELDAALPPLQQECMRLEV